MNSVSFIGSNLLSLSLSCALFSLLMYLVGHLKRRYKLIIAARRATTTTFILLTLSTVILISAFLLNNFSILYVYNYSSKSLAFYYKLTGIWAGLDGSLLFWTWLVSLYAYIVLVKNKQKNSDWMPYINAVMMTVIIFFLLLMFVGNNPFTPIKVPALDGRGMNPLLQNIAMVIHPPMLYLGYTGFTVPFAFVIAALITKRLDSSWIEDTRRWTIIAWFFLGIGLLLGGAWAYVELGWGGFWAWDPVENAGLFPWLTATAYLHSVLIEKRRGMLKVWNVTLVIITFTLTIFGTYLTRSGIVQSVHAFSDSTLGPYFVLFIVVILLFSFYLVVTRLHSLKSRHSLQSYLSKESSFLLNNVILLIATFAILWGTMFPTFSEIFTGQRISVGQPFFNRIMAPIALLLILLTGVGPMISWKKATSKNLRHNLLIPVVFGLSTGVVCLLLKIYHWYALISSMLIAFVFATIIIEFYRGIRITMKHKSLTALSSLLDLIIYSNRRFGGYIVHLGMLLIFLGISGAVYKTEASFYLFPTDQFSFNGYRFVYEKPILDNNNHRIALVTKVKLFRGNQHLKDLTPSRNFYFTSEQPTTEVDLYQTALKDVYLILGHLDTKTLKADFKATINPLISFLWIGGFILLIGVIVVILPRGWRL